MSEVKHDEFLPTIQFGFLLKEGEQVLCQMWVTPWGLTEWRPVPMIETSEERKPSIAGYLEEDDEDR